MERARFVTDVRREPINGGFVQQHLFVIKQKDGRRLAWPVCIVVKIRAGKIERLDEYMDREGPFEPDSDVRAGIFGSAD